MKKNLKKNLNRPATLKDVLHVRVLTKKDLQVETSKIRKDLHIETTKLRVETRELGAALRAETRELGETLRKETSELGTQLRSEIQGVKKELQNDIAMSSKEIIQTIDSLLVKQRPVIEQEIQKDSGDELRHKYRTMCEKIDTTYRLAVKLAQDAGIRVTKVESDLVTLKELNHLF